MPRNFISLKEASNMSGYHPDYISALIRNGKIEGQKIGRNWFTTKKSIEKYLFSSKFNSVRSIIFSTKGLIFISAFFLVAFTFALIFWGGIEERENPEEAGVHLELSDRTDGFLLESSEVVNLTVR